MPERLKYALRHVSRQSRPSVEPKRPERLKLPERNGTEANAGVIPNAFVPSDEVSLFRRVLEATIVGRCQNARSTSYLTSLPIADLI